MIDPKAITALRMERQLLTRRAGLEEYDALYRDTSPGQNVYWHGFGQPPTLSFRADFDDLAYNGERQRRRVLLKGRFQGGNLGWIHRDDLEMFAALSRKPLAKPTERQAMLLELIHREGPMNIQTIKEMTGLLVKEITPALHRLQEAFLVYEDQFDGDWDRAWFTFEEMFPDADVARYTRQEALCQILPRFVYRHVAANAAMAKCFYKLPVKDVNTALAALVEAGTLVECDGMLFLPQDILLLESEVSALPPSVFVLHRNDFLVKAHEDSLKKRFPPGGHETLQYLLVDGEIHGAVIGKFKYGPYFLEDVLLDLPLPQRQARKAEIIEAIYGVNGREELLKLYDGQPV